MKNFSLKTRESYLLSSKYKKTRNVVVLCTTIFLVVFFGKDVVSSISMNALMPFYYVRHYIETSSATVPVFFRSRMELLDQIHILEQEIEKTKGNGVAVSVLTTENTELRALLTASTSPLILAGVISQPPRTPYDTMIIDRGSADGVQVHAPVFYGMHNVLGYVREVSSHSALVTLLSSPGVESTVYIYGPNIFTTAYGEGGGVIHVSIPQGLSLKKGDIVVTPTANAGVLGTISDVQSIPTEPEQHAYITYDVSMQSIRLVGVGTEPLEQINFDTARVEVEKTHAELFSIDIPPDAQVGMSTSTTSKNGSTTTASSTEH